MRTILACLSLSLLTASAHAENWPSWRGPGGMAVSSETNLPTTWSPTENIRWKVELPSPGNSSPIVWEDRVFLTQPHDVTKWPPQVPENFAGGSSAGGYAIAARRSVMCLDRASGRLLWQRDVAYDELEITHPTNPFCSASPVTDGEVVVASHGSAGLVAYDLAGNELWKYDVGKIVHLWGTASSPVLHGDLCIQWCGPGPRQYLLAVNKRTGAKVWEIAEPDGDDGITSRRFLGTWSTPFIARVGDREQLIFAVPHKLKGFDPQTGEELWSSSGPGNYCYSSPFTIGELAIFGDNVVQLGGTGDISKNRQRYRVGSMYISTAVVSGDYLYTYNNVGVPGCYDWKTGAELWKDQIEGRPGGTTAWGSPIFADGRIYIADQQGTTSVFKAGPKYQVVALNALKERCNATLAVSQGNLFLRTHKHLWCIGEAKSQ